MGDDAGRAAQPGSRRRVGSWGLSDAPLASGVCASVSSGVFVAPYRADDALGETRDSSAANRPDDVAIDADPQGERDVLRAACRPAPDIPARHPSSRPIRSPTRSASRDSAPIDGLPEMRKISGRV